MADKVPITGGVGTNVATDEIAGVHYQRVKPVAGADGVAVDVSIANPMPVVVSQTQQVPLLFTQFLDTVGDGSGVKNAIGDYSGGVTIFKVQPGAGVIYKIHTMIIHIEDGSGFRAERYAALGTALTVGIIVRVQDNGGTIVALTDATAPVKNNGNWAEYAGPGVDVKAWGAGEEQLVGLWEFAQCHGVPIRLDGDANERLEVVLNDDFTDVVDHHFVARGFKETTLT